MAKFLIVSTVFPVVFLFLFSGFFVAPMYAQAAAIKDSCVLSDNLDIEIPFKNTTYQSIVSIKEGSTISPQIEYGGIANKGAEVKFRLKAGGEPTLNYLAIKTPSLHDYGEDSRAALENKWGLICLVNTINSATNWIFFVLIAISFVMILIAGFMWVTAGTSAENQKKAGAMIIAALVGIAIALLSRIIPGVVIGILT